MVAENPLSLYAFIVKAQDILTIEIHHENPDVEAQIRKDALTIALGVSKFAEPMHVYDEQDGMQLYWQIDGSLVRINIYVKENSHAEVRINVVEGITVYENIPVDAVVPIVLPELEKLFTNL